MSEENEVTNEHIDRMKLCLIQETLDELNEKIVDHEENIKFTMRVLLDVQNRLLTLIENNK